MDSDYRAPDTIGWIGNHGLDEMALRQAADRLRTEPGLGALICGTNGIVTHRRFLADAEGASSRDALLSRLVGLGYDVQTIEGAAHAPAKPPWRHRIVWQLLRRPARERVAAVRNRWRRRRFIARLQYEAWLAGAVVEIDIAKDFRVEPGVRLELRPGRSSLTIGPACSMASGAVLRLGGDLRLVRHVELRHDVSLNVKGCLTFNGRNTLARGAMIHCDAQMVWEWGACAGEYVTVLDSDHEYDGSFVHVLDQAVRAKPMRIGAASLIGAHTLVMPGVHVGRACFAGAGSLLTKDVEDGWVVVGAPARRVRRTATEQR